jgi:prevent-host-death family protein
MHETVLTIDDAARTLPDLVERVHSRGESALLTKAGRPVARIVPVQVASQGVDDLIAFLRRWRAAHPEPDEGFGAAIEASRRAISPPRDPWE